MGLGDLEPGGTGSAGERRWTLRVPSYYHHPIPSLGQTIPHTGDFPQLGSSNSLCKSKHPEVPGVCIHMHVCVCICIDACVYMCTCAHVCVCICKIPNDFVVCGWGTTSHRIQVSWRGGFLEGGLMLTCQARPHLMPALLLLGWEAHRGTGSGRWAASGPGLEPGARPIICPPSLGLSFLHVTGSPPGLEEAVPEGRAGAVPRLRAGGRLVCRGAELDGQGGCQPPPLVAPLTSRSPRSATLPQPRT